jgi:NAD+ kinase
LERCGKLASFIGDYRQPDALNEIFITSRALAKNLYTKILRDGEFIAKCQSDGVVIASQVGSTGYSLSGGGPILDPEVDDFVLTPICPLTILPPIVFSAKSLISVEIIKPKSAQVVIDGYYQTVIEPKQPLIKISKSEYESSFIRFEKNFYYRLERRLFPEEGNFEKENSHP